MAVSFLLLVPPAIGIADNGDFNKMCGRFSLIAEPASAGDAPAFVSLRYVRDPKAFWVSDNFSTEIALIRAALSISDLLGSDAFDIRLLGAVHAAFFLAGFGGLLLVLRRLSDRAAVIAALLAFFVLGDVCYLSYCSTFFTDAAALAFVFPAMVCALAIALHRQCPVWLLVLFAACVCLFSLSKGQHALPAVLLAVYLVIVARKRWVIALGLAAAIMASSYLSLSWAPPQERAQYLFTLVFYKLAPDAQSAPPVLRELGLPAEYVSYAGMFTYSPAAPMNDLVWADQFGQRISQKQIAAYYLHHPETVIRLLQFDLHHWAKEMRSVSLGNYPRSAGKPATALTPLFGWWSSIRSSLFVIWEFHLPAWYLFVMTFSVKVLRARQSALAGLLLTVALMGAGEFLISSLADAGETARHLLMFHYLTDVSVCLFLLFLATEALARKKAVKVASW